MSTPVNLEVDLGAGLILRNPVLTASGTFGYGLEFEPFVDLRRLGGIVVKGISPRPRAGNPPPRLVETPSGMLNAIGLQNVGVERFIDDKLPPLRERDATVVVNVFGQGTEDYVAVAEALDGKPGVAALELNLSCPNVAHGGFLIGKSPKAVAEVTAAVRRVSRLPLWVKLTPNVSEIVDIAAAAADAGADALSLVNTYVGMVVDVERRRPVLANLTGGLSGPAIRPMAVAAVYQVARAVKIPLIGMGGIVCVRDIVEFLLVGASAVQVGTASFNEPGIAARLVDELAAWCRDHGVDDVRELVGAIEIPR
ncbi:MAG TPA: dihydroorotate dehydrogenase [Acidobacteria bacterium]|nr:dihydroorotate dehydrogenase [Acidobacteriota bacterium]